MISLVPRIQKRKLRLLRLVRVVCETDTCAAAPGVSIEPAHSSPRPEASLFSKQGIHVVTGQSSKKTEKSNAHLVSLGWGFPDRAVQDWV